MTSDSVRHYMLKAANSRKGKEEARPTGGASSNRRSVGTALAESKDFASLETSTLLHFHAGGVISNQLNILKYITSETTGCHDAIILRISNEGKTISIYCRSHQACDPYETYRVSDFECVQEVIVAKAPVIHNDDNSKQLQILCQWKPLFGRIPDVVVGVPILHEGGKQVGAIVALSFKRKIPKMFMATQLPELRETLNILVPYAFVSQARNDHDEQTASFYQVIQSLEKVEKVVASHTAQIALTQIGSQISALAKSKNFTIFLIDENDKMLRKFHTAYGTQGKATCPDKKLHILTEIPYGTSGIEILEWVVNATQGLVINNTADLQERGINTKHIHSVSNCSSKSIMVVPVVDFSGESHLVVEVCDKDKFYSPRELENVLLFCQHAACLLTCTILMDRREKNFRRKNIINEMLCSISFVKRDNVEQFITYHRKTSVVYKGHFDEFHLCVRCFPEADIAGIALEMFYDLDLLQPFKVRKIVLIRFIMSVQQGYGPLPYHNWYHAVSVAHFAYLLIKKLNLVELEHLTKLEAFALVVSALMHDIDHRGTNNQFQSYTNSDIFKLYACEESVMERHHLSIALAILHREDCNILESFNDEDYKYFVELLTWNIIATDISKHLKNREALFAEAKSGNPKQRKMARLSLFMTAADLCDNVKKWDENLPTVKGILTEFFNQGDMEKQLGFTPIQMMDRNAAYIPLIEYKFVKYIVSPVYRYLAELYDGLAPCYQNILLIEDLWALATHVFDSKKDVQDILEILDMPEMKEEALKKRGGKDVIDQIKTERFAPPPPVPPPATKVGKKSEDNNRSPSNSSNTINVPEWDEENMGEKRRKCKCCCFKFCSKKKK